MQHSSNFIVCIEIHLDCLWLMWSSSYGSSGLDRNRNVGQESPLLCSCFSLHCQHKLTWKLEDLAQHKCNSEMMSCYGAPTILFLSVTEMTSKGWLSKGRRQWERQCIHTCSCWLLVVILVYSVLWPRSNWSSFWAFLIKWKANGPFTQQP